MKLPTRIRVLFGSAITLLSVIALTPAVAQADLAAQPVLAQADDNPFSALVGRNRSRRKAPELRGSVNRYVLAADDRALLFEDRANAALVQFLCASDDQRVDCTLDELTPAPEIYQLLPTRAPRGDVIYKNDLGQTFLRIASYGGATVYWPGRSDGAAASKSFGDQSRLALPELSLDVVTRRARSATAIISAQTGEPVIFEIGVARSNGGGNYAVLADSIVRAAAGLSAITRDSTGARILGTRISKVAFARKEVASISMAEKTLIIGYVPDQDISGRPSSGDIAKFLEEQL